MPQGISDDDLHDVDDFDETASREERNLPLLRPGTAIAFSRSVDSFLSAFQVAAVGFFLLI